MSQKDERLKEIIRELAAEFFSRQSDRTSMITVTGVELTSRGQKATVLITVMPESKEDEALAFASRRLSDFREFVNEHSRVIRMPFFGVKIDKGEKNRQRMDDISKIL